MPYPELVPQNPAHPSGVVRALIDVDEGGLARSSRRPLACLLAHEEQRRAEGGSRGGEEGACPFRQRAKTRQNVKLGKAHICEMWKEGRKATSTRVFLARSEGGGGLISLTHSAFFGGLGRSTFSFGRQTANGERTEEGKSRGRERGHPSPRPKRARKTNGRNRTELMWWKGQIPLQ